MKEIVKFTEIGVYLVNLIIIDTHIQNDMMIIVCEVYNIKLEFPFCWMASVLLRFPSFTDLAAFLSF